MEARLESCWESERNLTVIGTVITGISPNTVLFEKENNLYGLFNGVSTFES